MTFASPSTAESRRLKRIIIALAVFEFIVIACVVAIVLARHRAN